MGTSTRNSLAALFALLAALTGLGFSLGGPKPSFQVEITTTGGRALPSVGNFALAGIEQTLVARATPPGEGVRFEWSVSPPALRTYEHDIQDAAKHRPIPLGAGDRKGGRLSFFWTGPRDGAEVNVRAHRGAESVSARVVFDVRLPRDANRDIYSFADDDRRRCPDGRSGSFTITRDHRHWHLGLRMGSGVLPVYAALHDAGKRLVWGDLGYRDNPARLFDLDYNGSTFLGWHGAALDAHRAWRRTFHVPGLDPATPRGALPIPGYLQRVPPAKSSERSRLYGYVRVGEFQNLDQLGRDTVHPWHNHSHTGIAKTNREPLMDNHGKSPPARGDLFWRWHSEVEEIRRALGPDRATVTAVYPKDGTAVARVTALYLAFDRKISFHAPPANKVQLRPALVRVNGKPAMTVTDVGGEEAPLVMFRLTGFPAPAAGPVRVELAGTPGIRGASWTFTQKERGAAAVGATAVPPRFRRRAMAAFAAAQARHRKKDIERLLAWLKPADADALWVSYLFRAYPLPAGEGVPILVGLLDHPSDEVKGRAIQTLLYRYAGAAASAEPKLRNLLRDPRREWWVRERAALALSRISPRPQEAIRQLTASLREKAAGEPVNLGSVEALGRFGPEAAESLPLLRKYLSATDPQAQQAAYRAVGRMVNKALPSPENLRKLKVVDWEAGDGGYAVHRALRKLGRRGAFAVPALVETFRRKPPVYVQGAVIETLGEVGGGAPAVKLLLAALPARWGAPGDPPREKFLSDLATEALARMPLSDPAAVPLLADALGHSDPVVRNQAGIALRKLGATARPAVGALVQALLRADGKTDPYEVGAYLSALRAIGPGARGAGATLVQLLAERSPLYRGQDRFWAHYIRAYILVTLGDIGTPAAAKPYLLDLLNNSDKTTAHGYAAAARALRPEMTEAIPGLLRALQPDFTDFPMSFDGFAIALGAEDVSCRLEALRALARMGRRARAALPAITQVAREKPDPVSPVPAWNEEARKALKTIRGKK
jgi:HEAT repeat protein